MFDQLVQPTNEQNISSVISQTDSLDKILQPINDFTNYCAGNLMLLLYDKHQSDKGIKQKLPMELQSVAAEVHIIYAIRAKLRSCATGQVSRCALPDNFSFSVSRPSLSLGLIVSVRLRLGSLFNYTVPSAY